MTDTRSIACRACGHALPAEGEAAPQDPCPACGSKARLISLSFTEEVAVNREESGEVIRDVEEPLSEHFGHGTAKFKVKPGGSK